MSKEQMRTRLRQALETSQQLVIVETTTDTEIQTIDKFDILSDERLKDIFAILSDYKCAWYIATRNEKVVLVIMYFGDKEVTK